MSVPTFDLEKKRLVDEIQRRKAKLVLIQLPEGLKPYGPKVAEIVQKAGALAVVSGDPCYGACDIAIVEADRLGADLLVHFGHNKIIEQTAIPTLYIEAKAGCPVGNLMKKATNFLKPWKKIGLVTTLQHSHKIVEMKEILLKEDKKVVIGNTGKLLRAGQVTGCDYSNAKAIAEKVEVFLFVGGGKFHALGVALSTRKPTIIADPYQKKVTPVEDVTKVMKKRWANIHETKQAKTIGVLVGLKIGQKRFDQALRIKKLLEDAGKKSVVLALKEITPEALMQFPTIDAFVNTACPRLSLDDNSRFQKPLLTPSEMCAVLGKLSWDELCRKGWFEN